MFEFRFHEPRLVLPAVLREEEVTQRHGEHGELGRVRRDRTSREVLPMGSQVPCRRSHGFVLDAIVRIQVLEPPSPDPLRRSLACRDRSPWRRRPCSRRSGRCAAAAGRSSSGPRPASGNDRDRRTRAGHALAAGPGRGTAAPAARAPGSAAHPERCARTGSRCSTRCSCRRARRQTAFRRVPRPVRPATGQTGQRQESPAPTCLPPPGLQHYGSAAEPPGTCVTTAYRKPRHLGMSRRPDRAR